MSILRWLVGLLALALVAGTVTFLAAYVITGDERWSKPYLFCRHWTVTILLAWFNAEVWGRVLWTLFHL